MLKRETWAAREWMCEACERAPAAFLCKADAASLCATCDSDIHSANPLARRHQRVPISPLSGPPAANPVLMIGLGPKPEGGFLSQEAEEETIDEEDEDEAASWLLFNPQVKHEQNRDDSHHGFVFNGEGFDEYLDLVEYNSSQENQFGHDDPQFNKNQQQHYFTVPRKSYPGDTDSVVPVQDGRGKNRQIQHHSFQSQKFQAGMEYEPSNIGYGYPVSISHRVSISSMDVGVVPESTVNDTTTSHARPSKGTIDLFSSPPVQMPTQLNPMDREARVLRYREKKKTRKFEKTIRYASRKAYAETRPRIKGRFAKRTDVELEMDQMFSTTILAENGYGVVPSF